MSSSRAPAATAAAPRGAGGGADHDQLWAKAAELERDFAGYKRRLSERRAQAAAAVAGGRADEDDERRGGSGDDAAGRGRRYEEYVRRRDERLRHEWRARMERKEAEMQALWARLDRAGSRGRRAGGELAAAGGHAGEDHVNLRQKPANLEVKVKPAAPITPRCSTATTKPSRPRTSVPSSPAAASPRLSTPDPRRRPSHLHRQQPQPEPPATPRKKNRLPPSSSTATVASSSPATPRPRPRPMLSRSRSLFKDRGCPSVTVRETVAASPRPPRLQPPRPSCDGASNLKEMALPLKTDAIAVTQRQSNACPESNEQAILTDLKKASAIVPEPVHPRRSGNGVEPVSPSQVIARDEPDSSEIAPAGDGNADSNKSSHEHVDQSSDKVGSVEITGDSDTEPSYVYIKKDSDEQTPRPCQQSSAGHATCPGGEPRSDSKDGDNVVNDAMESTGSNDDVSGETPVTDAEDASRRESSESLYSNVQSSFSPTSELDTSATGSPLPSATEHSPESDASPRSRKNMEMEDAGKSLPIPTTPRRGVAISITGQSPMDAVAGLKRLLTFGKKNGRGSEAAAAVVERTPRPMAPAPPAGHGCISGDWPAGDSVTVRSGSSGVASADDLDNSYVISPHVRSLPSFVPAYPANPELKEPVLYAKSPRVHRSFFSFSSFKSRA